MSGHLEMIFFSCIQDSFVEMGGMKTLTALLHSSEPRTVKEAASALSYMVSESEENQHIVVQESGYVYKSGTFPIKRYSIN